MRHEVNVFYESNAGKKEMLTLQGSMLFVCAGYFHGSRFAREMEVTEQQHEFQTASTISKWLASPARFLLLLAGYFVLQIILRLMTSNILDLDEAEQLLATQRLQWGYGPQPPLYTWLLFPFIQLSGPSLLTLTIFKNTLLFGIYSLTYLSAKQIFRDPVRSALTALSLIFVPQLSWEAQTDLTHSVMVTFMTVATFCAFLKMNRSRNLRGYLLFGICLGLGMLSKYSFAVFAIGLLLGAALVRETRVTVLNPRLLLSFLICVAMIAPHFIWARQHADWLLSTANKFKMATERPWLDTVLIGLKNLVLSVVSHLAPISIIYFVLFKRRMNAGTPAVSVPATARVIGAGLISMLVMLVLGVLAFKITAFKERWFLPLCLWTPILLMAIFSYRVNPARIRTMLWLAAAAAVAISVIIPTRIWFVKSWGTPQTLNAPLDKLAAEIRSNSAPCSYLVGNDNWISGNLKLRFPERTVLSPNNFLDVRVQAGEPCLVVWDAMRSEPFPAKLLPFVNQFAEVNPTDAHYVSAPYKFWPEKTMCLGFTMGKFKAVTGADFHSVTRRQ